MYITILLLVVTNMTAVANIRKDTIPVYNFAQLAPLLHQHNDTTYVINFWATWCKPCVEELPFFEQLNKETSGKKIKIILVSLDFKSQMDKKLIPFIQKNNIQSSVALLSDPDTNAWIPQVDDKWSGAIPVTLVYRNNKRQFWEDAFDSYDSLQKLVESFL